jgi:hypothetical protein
MEHYPVTSPLRHAPFESPFEHLTVPSQVEGLRVFRQDRLSRQGQGKREIDGSFQAENTVSDPPSRILSNSCQRA